MHITFAAFLALAASVTAKPASSTRTFAVNYFYGTKPLVEGRMDPIIYPGNPGGHTHTVMGGSNFALTMDDETALGSNCTNSKPKADNSNYWWPKLYFQDPKNGSLTGVDMYYAKVYYFFEPTEDEIKAFPPGLRMLTGNAMNRAPNDKKGQLNTDSGNGTINAVQFMCGGSNKTPYGTTGLNDPGDPSAHGVGFPDANCDGDTTPLRYDLHFPSCYNPDAGPDNYKENMAFPSSKGAKYGQNCPEGWIHTPHLFYEVYWDTTAFASLWTPGQGKQPFVLAQGDPTGFGLHADFLSGWEEDKLQAIIDTCDTGDSGMHRCSDIDSLGGVNDSTDSCTIPSAFPKEDIQGPFDQLPGCNPLQYGPGPASAHTADCGETFTNKDPTTYAATSAPSATGTAATATGTGKTTTTPKTTASGKSTSTGKTTTPKTTDTYKATSAKQTSTAEADTYSTSKPSTAKTEPVATTMRTATTPASSAAGGYSMAPKPSTTTKVTHHTHHTHHRHTTTVAASVKYVTENDVVYVTKEAQVTKYVTA